MTPDEKLKAEAYEVANANNRIELRTSAKNDPIQEIYDLIERCEARGYRDVNTKILESLAELDKTFQKYEDTKKY